MSPRWSKNAPNGRGNYPAKASLLQREAQTNHGDGRLPDSPHPVDIARMIRRRRERAAVESGGDGVAAEFDDGVTHREHVLYFAVGSDAVAGGEHVAAPGTHL